MTTQKNTIDATFRRLPSRPEIHFREAPEQPLYNCFVPVKHVPTMPLGIAFILMGVAFAVGHLLGRWM